MDAMEMRGACNSRRWRSHPSGQPATTRCQCPLPIAARSAGARRPSASHLPLTVKPVCSRVHLVLCLPCGPVHRLRNQAAPLIGGRPAALLGDMPTTRKEIPRPSRIAPTSRRPIIAADHLIRTCAILSLAPHHHGIQEGYATRRPEYVSMAAIPPHGQHSRVHRLPFVKLMDTAHPHHVH